MRLLSLRVINPHILLIKSTGKTNFAMMQATLPGWKVEVLGDDIAWLRIVDGRLRAINPE